MTTAEIDPLLEGLTDAQREAVLATEGPVLILAAAGSGKTRVITRRIAYLLSLGVPPWQILALTFTNKAAGEMRERVGVLLGPDAGARGLTVTTFHALCARLLRRYAPLMEGRPGWAIRHDYTIYDADDQQALMKRVIGEMNLTSANWPPRSVLASISHAKNELKDALAFEAGAGDFYSRSLAKIYQAYERALRGANAVDFDDLLMLTVRLLQESDEARDEVQGRWKYLMIDEYQDTNHAQFLLSSLLVTGAGQPGGANVCVVGDPDQSIYGWRGADIANILDFEEQYPGARVVTLGQNFRSTAPILATADALIRRNKRRKHKDLFTTRPGGEKPEVVLCRDEHHEARLVVDWLKARREAGTPEASWKDMAVFYRNNALSRVIEDELRGAGVPYVIARGTAFYQREEVKDALSYLRVVANPADEVSLSRIINKPARKIGKASLARVEHAAAERGITLFEALGDAGALTDIGPGGAGAMRRFVEMVDGWTGGGSFLGAEVSASLAALVERVLNESGLRAHYKAAAVKSESDEDKLANLDELVSSAREFEESYDPESDPALAVSPGEQTPTPPLLAMLRAYLESVSLVADADKVDPASGAVTLMTLHAAKGLEFHAVAIVGLEENLLPSSRALEGDPDAEEERRLCFVGITRAMSRLLITASRYRTLRGLRERTIPSRFLTELPAEQIALSDQSETMEDFDDTPSFDGPVVKASRPHAGGERPPRGGGLPTAPGYGFSVGSRVRHPQFGEGEVKVIQGVGVNLRATIAFRDAGTKTLVLQYARLTTVG